MKEKAINKTISANEISVEEDIKNQIEHDNKKLAYNYYLIKEKKELYDIDFVDFYRNGKIIIRNHIYKTSDLFLEFGLSNNEESLFLVYYAFPQKDVLTQKEKINFKRTNVIEFRSSTVFYKIYNEYKNNIKDNTLIINDDNIAKIDRIAHSSDGTKHTETPETAYGRVKPRFITQGDL